MTEAASKRGVEFFLPYLPGRALSPNGAHGHWAVVGTARAELRGLVAHWPELRNYSLQSSPFDPARVSLTMRRTNKNPRDGY